MKKLFKSTTFLAILACWLWSTAFAGVKVGLEHHTPLQFAGMRFFLSGVLIFFYFGNAALLWSQLKINFRFILLVALVQIFVQYALFYSGLDLVPGALGAMIIGSSPLFVAAVAHFAFANDKMTWMKTLSILIGVVGIAIITLGRTKVEMKDELEYLGIGLLLVNNLISGYSNVLVAKSPATVSPIVLSSTSLMIGGLMLFTVSIPIEGLNFGPFPVSWYLALAWLSFLSAAAITIWYSLLRRPKVKVSELNVWKFLIPVSGAILSWIIIEEEKPDWMSIMGMAVIALSLIILSLSASRKRTIARKKDNELQKQMHN